MKVKMLRLSIILYFLPVIFVVKSADINSTVVVPGLKPTITSSLVSTINTNNNSSTSTAVVRNFNDIKLIDDLLDIFNLAQLGSQWSTVREKLSTICARDMTEYFYGLEKGKLWALKSK